MKSGLLVGWMGRAASLSARRVWIEIFSFSPSPYLFSSLSARRVWIEIPRKAKPFDRIPVTLREEGVD